MAKESMIYPPKPLEFIPGDLVTTIRKIPMAFSEVKIVREGEIQDIVPWKPFPDYMVYSIKDFDGAIFTTHPHDNISRCQNPRTD